MVSGRDFTVRGEVILADKASKALRQVSGNLNKFGSQLMTTGSRIRSTGQSMTIGLTAPIVGGFLAVIQKAGKFQDEMAKILGLSNANAAQVAIWEENLLGLAVALGKSPQELAEGLFFLASAGLAVGTEMDVLNIAGRASVAGLGEVKVIAQALANVIAAYGQENIDTADTIGVMIAAVREGNVETDEMAGVFGKLLPLASELGIAFPEIAGALSALSLINADVNENATAFLGIMRAFVKPTAEGTKTLAKMGLTFEDLRQEIDEKGLIVTLGRLREGLGGIEEVAKVFPRVRGLTGLLNLTGVQAEKVDEVFRAVAAGGAADLEKAFEAAQTPAQRLRQIMARLDVAIIRLAPVIDVVAEVLDKVVGRVEILSDKFATLSPRMQKIVVVVAIVLAALGPLLIIIGALIAAVGAAITLFGAIGSVISFVASAILLLNPVTLALIAIIIVLAAIAFLVWKNWDAILGFLRGAWKATSEFIVSKVTWLRDQIVEKFQSVSDFVTNIWAKVSDFVVSKATSAWGFVTGVISDALSIIKKTVDNVWGSIGEDIIETLTGIQETAAAWAHRFQVIFGAVFDRTKKIVGGAFDIMSRIVTSVFDRWVKITRGNLNIVMRVFTSVFDRVAKIVGGTFDVVSAIFRTVFSIIRAKVLADLTLVATIISNTMLRIVGFFRDNWDTIVNLLRGVWLVISGLVRIQIQAMLNVIEIAMALLRGDWGAAWEAIKDLFGDAWDAIKQILSGVLVIITSLIKLAWEGIKQFLFATWETIVAVAENRWNLVKDKIASALRGAWNLVKFLMGLIKDAIVTAFNETVAFITGLGGRLFDAGLRVMGALARGVKAGINIALSNIEDGINRMMRGIAKGISKIKDFADAIPGPNLLGSAMGNAISALQTGISIPQLTRGGLVAKTGLAVVHEGETFSGVGGGGTVVLHIENMHLGGRATEQDAEEFMDMVERKLRERRIRFQ